jgi:lipopolysaccharide transport protein LptA
MLASAAAQGAHAAKGDCDSANQASWPVCEAGNLCLCAADDVEYRSDKVLLNDVVLYQGGSPLLVRAQHAETPSIDFTDSTWNLSGGVTSRLAQGKLEADNAVVHIKKGDLSAATFHGTPATFEESPALTARPGATVTNVRGSAQTIDYDTQSGGEVRLVGDVQLNDGCKDIHGSGFIYNLTQKSLKSLEPAAGASRERIRGTFQRGCKPQAPGTAPSATPSPTPSAAPGNAPATAPAAAPPSSPPTPPTVVPKAAPWSTPP